MQIQKYLLLSVTLIILNRCIFGLLLARGLGAPCILQLSSYLITIISLSLTIIILIIIIIFDQ